MQKKPWTTPWRWWTMWAAWSFGELLCWRHFCFANKDHVYWSGSVRNNNRIYTTLLVLARMNPPPGTGGVKKGKYIFNSNKTTNHVITKRWCLKPNEYIGRDVITDTSMTVVPLSRVSLTLVRQLSRITELSPGDTRPAPAHFITLTTIIMCHESHEL